MPFFVWHEWLFVIASPFGPCDCAAFVGDFAAGGQAFACGGGHAKADDDRRAGSDSGHRFPPARFFYPDFAIARACSLSALARGRTPRAASMEATIPARLCCDL